ncbi:MAG: hypothetical protein OEQ74_06815 [Gammaproteobacteria bacterium]|nr:hypothetical protein [Gammaproteobacteria bacterium]
MRLVQLAIAILSVAGCATTSSNAWARFSDGSLNEWLGDEAVPGLTETFSQFPRFKGEVIHIAVLDGEQVAGDPNGLSTATRDAVHSALLQVPGLNIVRVDGPENCMNAARGGYYLAIDATGSGSRSATVTLRIFDIVERQWVSGFGYEWRGDLTGAQREALRRSVIADSTRGLRVSPFSADQSDLLAARLAADLACKLRLAGNDELVVQPVKSRSAALIAGNLARTHEIPVSADGVLLLDTRIHKVNERLYQVWAILTPVRGTPETASIASSYYATRPLLKSDTAKVVTRIPAVAATETMREPDLVAGLTIVGPADQHDCETPDTWRREPVSLGDRPVVSDDDCFGLAFQRHPQAQIYVVNHQVDSGLVRLYPSRCEQGVPVDRFPAGANALGWDARSGTETFYVLAARGQRVVSRLDRLMAQLPDACESQDKDRLPAKDWLNDIDAAVRGSGDDVAWQAVRVYHQPASDTRRLGDNTGAAR